ncbi:carbohydrate kinase family protein [Hahella ganghwensis]|uniref:carbohydrate kinase family protein n=1 Tax=Hahella ganghwensis TaxID=286420 RepID=UPI00036A904B|nr:carbohydrate kinase [Hahella ganghwensis]
MQPVLCFGEALIDCLQTSQSEVDGLMLPQFTHFPGGAPANVAVAVAKLGGNAHFAGQVGKDAFGEFLKGALERYGVHTRQLHQHESAPTPLAFVLLDDEGERSFSFYRTDTADLLFEAGMIEWEQFSSPGILHLCSNTLTDDDIFHTTLEVINQAKALGWKISFDINFRDNLWAQPEQAPERIATVVEHSDVIKASGEELELLYPNEDLLTLIKSWVDDRLVVITDGGKAVTGYFGDSEWTIEVPKVQVVDTTSAGDSFVGGLLFQLSQLTEWDNVGFKQAVDFAVRCGAITVTRAGAYPALPWANELE